MPKLSATDGAVGAIDHIKQVDLSIDDIRKMSDDELANALALLRKNRESVAPRATRARKDPATATPRQQIVDDDDISSDY